MMNNSNKRKSFCREDFKRNIMFSDPGKSRKILENAIHEIYNNNALSHKFEDLYSHVYHLVINELGEKLYEDLVITMMSHVITMSESIQAAQGDFFLEELIRKWKDHKHAVEKIRSIMTYMDVTYIVVAQQTQVSELGLKLWINNVVNSRQIHYRLLSTILDSVDKERNGEIINRDLLRKTIEAMMDLGLSAYEQVFELPFFEALAQFHRVESKKFLECCDCANYMKKVEKHMTEEMDRMSHYLYPGSQKKLAIVIWEELIGKHMYRLIHMEKSGLVNMLVEDKYEDLRKMFHLFLHVPGGYLTMLEVMISHAASTVKLLVTDPEKLKDPVEYVQLLINHKYKYDRILNLGFSNDKKFQVALDSMFEQWINLNPRTSEFVALFVDDRLRKGLMGASKEAMDNNVDKVVMLVRSLHDKHMFQMHFYYHLMKRLFSMKALSDDDPEISLGVKLRKVCGYHFNSQFNTISNDVRTSKEMLREFYTNHHELGDGPTVVVRVLTTGTWVTKHTPPCNLPLEVSSLCEKYESYYMGIYSKRKLSWQTCFGTTYIEATFGHGQKHELYVSTYHMCVLMLFNNDDELGYKEIQKATQIPTSDLKECLHSLTLVKGQNVLRKVPPSEKIGQDDMFSVNDKFTSKFYEVRVVTDSIAKHQYEAEALESQKRVEMNKGPHIDAVIVKIMKSVKKLDHNNLIAEVIKQTQSQFPAYPIEIKKRIESLIDRDYLERDGIDRALYRYLP